MKILVIEDERMLNRGMEDALKRNKYPYDWAETGNDAWEMLSKNEYSLVILDAMVRPGSGLNIPGTIQRREMGLHLVSSLRDGCFTATGTKPDVPVVVCTAITDAKNIEAIKKFVGDKGAFYQKPKKPSEIMVSVKQLLE